MSTGAEVRQLQRRRAAVLKMIRQGHEAQLSRMDDFEVYKLMQDAGNQMSRNQIVTMLQDLAVMGYVKYQQAFDDDQERMVLREIELTSMGTSLVIRRQSNDEVLFG